MRRQRLGTNNSNSPANSGKARPAGIKFFAVVWLGAVVCTTSFAVPEPPVTVEGVTLHVVFAGTPEQVSVADPGAVVAK